MTGAHEVRDAESLRCAGHLNANSTAPQNAPDNKETTHLYNCAVGDCILGIGIGKVLLALWALNNYQGVAAPNATATQIDAGVLQR